MIFKNSNDGIASVPIIFIGTLCFKDIFDQIFFILDPFIFTFLKASSRLNSFIDANAAV